MMLCIDRILMEKGMTQKMLADRLGVSVQAVNSAVCGRSNMSEKLLTRYADTLGVKKDDLFDDFL